MLKLPWLGNLFSSVTNRSHVLRNLVVIPRRFITTDDMTTVNTTERLTRLRELMRENDVDIYSEFNAGIYTRSTTD